MSPAVGPYSPVRRAGDWVITSGQVGLATDASGAPALAPGGTFPELHQALANVADVLELRAATLADVVKTTLYLVDMGEFAAVNDVVWSSLPTSTGRRVRPSPSPPCRSAPGWRWRRGPTFRCRQGRAESDRAAIPLGRSGTRQTGRFGSDGRAPRPTWPGAAGCAHRPCGPRRSTRSPRPG